MKDNKWMVYIQCSTFNHAPYITDAMNGFTMQQTDFPFVCAIVDDASTDGEPEVIRKYLQDNFDLEDKSVVRNEETDDYVLCFAQHKTNKNCYFAVLWLKYNHYSIKKSKKQYYREWENNAKYIAICEGDDYWIDSQKIRKQVDFLEHNSEYNMIYTRYKENHNGEIIEGAFNLLDGYCLESYLRRKGFIPTASVMYRADFVFERDYAHLNLPMGDVPTWIQLMHNAPIKLLDDITTVYRILPESASHSRSFLKTMFFLSKACEIRHFFALKYGYNDVAQEIGKEQRRITLLIDLYNGNFMKFVKSSPMKYGIGLKTMFEILYKRYKDKFSILQCQ